MTPDSHRERILAALRGNETDRLPRGEFYISDEFIQAFGAGDSSPAPRDLPPTARVVDALDLDIAPVSLSLGWGAPSQPDTDRALEAVMQWHAQARHFVTALIDGPFSVAVQTRGFNALMHAVRGAPHVARDLLRQGAEETLLTARAAHDAGADGVVLGEDIAYGQSTFISPTELRDLYWPSLGDAVRALHASGLAVFFHSEGNLNGILDDLRTCGLDGLEGLEPESGMQVAAVRARVGADLTLWGNLSFDFLSAPRTDAEIDAAVRELIAASPDPEGRAPRRYIFGSCGGLVQGLNIETVKRVYARLG